MQVMQPMQRNLQALLCARMPHSAVTADIGTREKPSRYARSMLRALPFQTIGDVGRHGLELHVYCPELLHIAHRRDRRSPLA